MATIGADAGLAAGYEALATADWERACEAFGAVLEQVESPEALDGMGRALWWLRDARGAIVHRERAYAGFRREGELARAARIALWLSREYAVAFSNDAAARGWIARAERLLRDVAPGAEQGWLYLARSERASDPAQAAVIAAQALEVSAAAGDVDLELRSLAQLGLAEVGLGRVDDGLSRLDEAMAGVTSGEPTSLETFADISCTLMLACDLAGDQERPHQWTSVLEDFVRRYDHVTLLAFCRTCCADVFAAKGRIDAAEEELVVAMRELEESGQSARCTHPAARLAEIRVLQGRYEEASLLLEGLEDEPDAIAAVVAIRLARGEAAAAEEILERRLDAVGRGNLVSAPLLAQLVEARISSGRLEEAREAAAALGALASGSARERVEAMGDLAAGRVARALGDPDAADALRRAVNGYAALVLALDAARARLELARVLADVAPGAAVDVARRAYNELESFGAVREADEAAALMRALGSKNRAGPRAATLLTKRERNVLHLLGEGLSNKAIAGRLYISPKTAEHHVSRIYAKLGVGSRAEAAAYAVRNLGSE